MTPDVNIGKYKSVPFVVTALPPQVSVSDQTSCGEQLGGLGEVVLLSQREHVVSFLRGWRTRFLVIAPKSVYAGIRLPR
jgi:hypothetical protein